MKFILITAPGFQENEITNIIWFLDQGLDRLHIRKPNWSGDQIKHLLSKIPQKYFPKLSLHGHEELAGEFGVGGIHYKSPDEIPPLFERRMFRSKSFHTLEVLLDSINQKLDYAFLSPVFNSISKKNYPSGFDPNTLTKWLGTHKKQLPFALIALGGISPSKVCQVKDMGFDGIAVMGAIWEQKSDEKRREVFQELLKKTQHGV